jgi:hypothetical protein
MDGRIAMAEKVFTAVLGALAGSLLGRLVTNPGWLGHIAFITAGAVIFLLVDRWRKLSSYANHHTGPHASAK